MSALPPEELNAPMPLGPAEKRLSNLAAQRREWAEQERAHIAQVASGWRQDSGAEYERFVNPVPTLPDPPPTADAIALEKACAGQTELRFTVEGDNVVDLNKYRESLRLKYKFRIPKEWTNVFQKMVEQEAAKSRRAAERDVSFRADNGNGECVNGHGMAYAAWLDNGKRCPACHPPERTPDVQAPEFREGQMVVCQWRDSDAAGEVVHSFGNGSANCAMIDGGDVSIRSNCRPLRDGECYNAMTGELVELGVELPERWRYDAKWVIQSSDGEVWAALSEPELNGDRGCWCAKNGTGGGVQLARGPYADDWKRSLLVVYREAAND